MIALSGQRFVGDPGNQRRLTSDQQPKGEGQA
jgi:hypothetical protein